MKKYSFILLMLLVCTAAIAQTISQQEAEQKAMAFLQSNKSGKYKIKGSNLKLTPVAQRDVLKNTKGTQLHLFNIESNGGFVIISGDERTPAVLGYANSGRLDATTMPANMQAWLEMYANEISHLGGEARTAAPAIHSAVEPCVTTQWNQGAPYNNQCPIDPMMGSRCLTGCVATAMAQALSVFKPAGCTELKGYYTGMLSIEVPALPATTFNWGILRDVYYSSENDASTDEVAKLLRYCGQAVEMDYALGGSGASVTAARDALKNNFGMSPNMDFINRNIYSAAAWDQQIYKEVSQHHPVIIGGTSAEGGHAFLCDGYDGNGLYHINWGWGGYCDGFFLIDKLAADYPGFNGTSNGFAADAYAVVGIRPAEPGETELKKLGGGSFFNVPSSMQRTADGFHFTASQLLYHYSEATSYDIAIGIFDEEENLLEMTASQTQNFAAYSGYNFDFDYNIAKNLSDGTYSIRVCSRQTGTDTWSQLTNAYTTLLIMTISGDWAYLEFVPTSRNNPQYEFSNVDFSGMREYTLAFDVKNTGDCYASTYYAIVDLDNSKGFQYNMDHIVSTISLNMDPGESESMDVKFIYEEAGQHTVTIAWYNYDTQSFIPIVSKDFVVEERSYCHLKGNTKIVSQYSERRGNITVPYGPMTVESTLTNDNSIVFRSLVRCTFYKFNDEDNMYYTESTQEVLPTIEANSSLKQQFTINELVAGKKHGISISYLHPYQDDPEHFMYFPIPGAELWFSVGNATGIETVGEKDEKVPVYTLDGRRVAPSQQRGLYVRGGKKFVVSGK